MSDTGTLPRGSDASPDDLPGEDQLARPQPLRAARPGMRIVVSSLAKGGASKSTTVLTLAEVLGRRGYRVLAVDLDPQGMLGANLAGVTVGSSGSVGAALGTDLTLGEVLVRQVTPGVDLAGAQRSSLEAARVRMQADQVEGLHWLSDELAALRMEYDYCLIDTPPGLDTLSRAALVAADSLLVPLPVEPLAYLGLADLLGVARKVAERQNPDLRLVGILRQFYDPRLLVTRSLLEQLVSDGLPVLRTTVPRSTRVPDASGMGMAVTAAFPDAPVAKAYEALADELVELVPPTGSGDTVGGAR